jgi:hypothetical protein
VPWEITIRGNRFIRGGTCLGYADSPSGAALAVRASALGFGLAEAEVIRDVVIDNNKFRDREGAAIYVGGARSVSVRKNRILAGPQNEQRRKGAAMLIERSSGLTLTDNGVFDPRPGTMAAIEIGSDVAAKGDGVRISGLRVKLNSQAQPIIDRRPAR